MTFLIAILAISVIVYWKYEVISTSLWHRSIPADVRADDQMVNMGIIPYRLGTVIPVDFELREDWTMRSRIESIFVDGNKRPLWCLVITLKDSICETESIVLYNLDGTLYQY